MTLVKPYIEVLFPCRRTIVFEGYEYYRDGTLCQSACSAILEALFVERQVWGCRRLDILIVEDNRQTLDAFSCMFERMGHRPRPVISTDDALRELDRKMPQVVLTDWDLNSSISGIDIATYALYRCELCMVMFCTGNSLRLLKQQTSHLRICRYFQKPVSLSQLRTECSAVFENHHRSST